MSEKHPAEVLAIRLECSEFPRMYAIPDACAMLRTIPALEAERDQLRAEVERLKDELEKAHSLIRDLIDAIERKNPAA